MLIKPVALGPGADLPHPPNADEWWQESVVLGWADPSKQIGGFMRIGHQPNRGFTKCCFGVVSKNGPGYTRSVQDLPYRPWDRTEDTFSTDEFLFVKFDDQRSRWTASDADCELDLFVQDAHPVYDFFSLTGGHTEVSKTITPNHIQAGGTFKGTVRIGDESHDVSGFTYRDHSWGTRLLHNPKADFYAAWWLGGSFGPDFSFGFGDGRAQSGDNMPFSYIVKDGLTYKVSVQDATVATAFADGMSISEATVIVSCDELGELTFVAKGYGSVVLEMERKHFELSMPSTITCGDRHGGGIVDTIFNPRNGTSRPFFLVGAALENGLNRFSNGRIQLDQVAPVKGSAD
ncbi:MAG TPA: hypothetical protein VJS38_15645 [Phenylobacterium sp.]|uniref:DUF7065 domain-containing protein n=1 Tax=Phenylobacterium sp. TaxID=1871053 RepID=UPI002B49116C|nr:hypothetical protein [Phenylobacterium sp.]HKR89606.1 hypothetical protein [Phenylobacterium sp.]